MADFMVTVDGASYDSRDAAMAAVRDAWDAWKLEHADPRATAGDVASYLRFKADSRPPGYEPTDEERESFEARLAEADLKNETAVGGVTGTGSADVGAAGAQGAAEA